jgi:hypothetical protein
VRIQNRAQELKIGRKNSELKYGSRRCRLRLTEEDRNRRTQELLARMGATKDSLGVLAGSILQLGKQVLSFHFGTKPPNIAGARTIGSQSIVEAIWEGRNHALHWEEGTGRSPIQNMLSSLTI